MHYTNDFCENRVLKLFQSSFWLKRNFECSATRAAQALGSGMKNCAESKLSSICFISSTVLRTPMFSYMTTHLQA